MSKIKRQKLFKKMRSVVKIEHLPTMIVGTVVLAIFANTYELACTLALPVVFTDILIIHNVPLFHAYLYILLYNIIYVIPLIIIVLLFVVTLGRRKLSEYQGRILKLFSGIMMFSFGLVMLFNPGLLKNVFAALGIILISIVLTVVISFIWKKLVKKRSSSNQGI
jgi:cytochrome c biogenesis protein CcdA